MDWLTWPVFSIYVLAFLLMIFRGGRRFLGIKMHTIIAALLILGAMAIALSLYHDSTDPLKLYF